MADDFRRSMVTSHAYVGGPFDYYYYNQTQANELIQYRGGGSTRHSRDGDEGSYVIENRADDIESYQLVSGKNILVIACAFGYLCNELASRGASVTGLDISDYAIEQAETLFPSLTFVQADALITGLRKNDYDIVIGNGIIMCMNNGDQLDLLIQEIARVLNPSGWFYGLSDLTPQWYYVIDNSSLVTKFENWFGSGMAVITDTGHLPIRADRRIVVGNP